MTASLVAPSAPPSTGLLVGLFGRLTPWKGQRVLMEAVARMPGATMVLVGAPLFGEHTYEAALRARAAEPDLAGRVHFLGFRADVAELMHCMDVVVHASVWAEPFGRVVVEGMLAARPVVATAAGGVKEIVDDGETGILVSPDDAPALASALNRLADEAERDQMGVRARGSGGALLPAGHAHGRGPHRRRRGTPRRRGAGRARRLTSLS